jgi:hypothetical protein
VIRGRYWIGEGPKRKFSFGMLAKGVSVLVMNGMEIRRLFCSLMEDGGVMQEEKSWVL